MFSSIQSAAAWKGWEHALTHFAVVLGDQPQIQPETLRTLLRFSASHPAAICQPACRGCPAHPVILPRTDFNALANTSAPTLKDFLETRTIQLREVQDPGLELDLDTPEDYEKALRLARSADC